MEFVKNSKGIYKNDSRSKSSIKGTLVKLLTKLFLRLFRIFYSPQSGAVLKQGTALFSFRARLRSNYFKEIVKLCT